MSGSEVFFFFKSLFIANEDFKYHLTKDVFEAVSVEHGHNEYPAHLLQMIYFATN